ncbi:hypothetical protein RMN57_32465 [Kitasatospora sp. CM 4170]|uniref:Uncharacterized protein n=1 Tax=Kitasatospora aburaviensis TaxID=67265 RepID=A0ABW1F336_9ACTN|nr:hypothetical protein [Kitasatospora sp. CM 4170]WNM49072.1 hypothetical protein RMN57_32465 [Kitasatospora sp. CM 4170]
MNREGSPEPPVEPVGWERVREFVVSDVERPATPTRARITWGPRAIRVPKGGKNDRVLAPCAYVATSARPLPVSVPPAGGPELTLFEDTDATRLLCYVGEPQEGGGERRHPVHDGDGRLIGTLRRVSPRRPFRHTWAIDQPGRPSVVGRNEWIAGGSPKDALSRAAGRFALGVVDSLASLGAEGGDQPAKPRTLEWRAGDEVVMLSAGSEKVTVQAEWVDRRLAFAFALLGDH